MKRYLILAAIFLTSFSHLSCHEKDPDLFVGAIIKNNDALIPFFLRSLEQLDYDTKYIYLQLNICTNSKDVQRMVANWAQNRRNRYKQLTIFQDAKLLDGKKETIEKNKIFGKIKDSYLIASRELHAEYCCILSSDVFLLPHTLKYLVQKKMPIIAPLLRPIPEPGDPFRNFFAAVSDQGYYKDHPDYTPISNRQKIGTFQVPCVHGAYLIDCAYADRIHFMDQFVDWEFLSFSKSARKQHIPQFICNEKEFGFFLHHSRALSEEQERAFTVAGTEWDISRKLFHSIMAPYCSKDSCLQSYIDSCALDEYAIYRVAHDLFYVDGIHDYIKSYFVKQGCVWEEHIQELFKKYVRPGDTVLDIGGHIGTHALCLSKIVGDRGTVHVFEPQRKLFCELAVNMHLNQRRNVQLYRHALGAEEKWVGISIAQEEWIKKFDPTLVNEGHGAVVEASCAGTDQVKMVRLDDLHLSPISFIKLDVEGYEMDVIDGGMQTIQRDKPVMIIEIFDGPDRARKIEQIEALGYTCTHIGAADFLFIPKNE